MNTTVVAHPLAAIRLTALRESGTNRAAFRQNLHEISIMVVYEATRSLRTNTIEIETPLQRTTGARLAESPLVVPVLRAGLGMLDAAMLLVPDSTIGFIGVKRNEETLQPDAYVNTVPDDLGGLPCLVLDPMLATGGSLVHTCDLLRQANAGPITVACVLAAPEGIATLNNAHPEVATYTAAIDDSLNDVAFIQPGLGDAGDRQFGVA